MALWLSGLVEGKKFQGNPKKRSGKIHSWLVVTGTWLLFSHILEISSSQLTKSNLFQRGRAQPPTSHPSSTIIHYYALLFTIIIYYHPLPSNIIYKSSINHLLPTRFTIYYHLLSFITILYHLLSSVILYITNQILSGEESRTNPLRESGLLVAELVAELVAMLRPC